MADSFSTLETNILTAKGLGAEQIAALGSAGITSREGFKTVGDAATLVELIPGLDRELAGKIMVWATGSPAEPAAAGKPVTIDTADVVYCVHCGAKQPKDYSSGDLCVGCGKQAEPIQSCYWCGGSGPGRFCRGCGAEFVPTAEFDLALLLRREGLAKDAIPERLGSMTAADKDQLWSRARKLRG